MPDWLLRWTPTWIAERMPILPEWLVDLGPWLMAGSFVLSAILLVVSGFALPRVIVGLPADALVRDDPEPVRSKGRLARNLLGWTLIVLGVLMLVLPGQGVLTVLAGLVLADVPGKRGMIRRLLATGPVLRAVTALRERAGQPPLLLPADD